MEWFLLARRLGFGRVELRLDSVCVASYIQGTAVGCAWGVLLVGSIRKLLGMDWEVHISHVYCEVNKCADCLASIGCDQSDSLRIHDQPSLVLEPLLGHDVRGISTPKIFLVYTHNILGAKEPHRLICIWLRSK